MMGNSNVDEILIDKEKTGDRNRWDWVRRALVE